MYTRDQLDALIETLHQFAGKARVDMRTFGTDHDYFAGKHDAYEVAASHVLALIESEEEIPA